MSQVEDILWVRMTGVVDEDVIDLLCAEFGMERCGRLDDDYDQLFGERSMRPIEEGASWLEHYRESEAEWDVALTAEPPFPTTEEVRDVYASILRVAKKANLSAHQTYPSAPVGEVATGTVGPLLRPGAGTYDPREVQTYDRHRHTESQAQWCG